MEEKAGRSVGLWLCKGLVVREQWAQGGLRRWKRIAARFSKCRVEGEQRGRGPKLPHHEGSHRLLGKVGLCSEGHGEPLKVLDRKGTIRVAFQIRHCPCVEKIHWRGTVGGQRGHCPSRPERSQDVMIQQNAIEIPLKHCSFPEVSLLCFMFPLFSNLQCLKTSYLEQSCICSPCLHPSQCKPSVELARNCPRPSGMSLGPPPSPPFPMQELNTIHWKEAAVF